MTDYTDLVKRLRATLYYGHGEEADLPDDAADAIEALTAERDALLAPVEYDEVLNTLGWEMNRFLHANGAKFDGRVFNNMKGFLHGAISEWLMSRKAKWLMSRKEGVAPPPVKP